ncbi:MAG: 3-keto-5-aminohexanoate cleavage protein [Thermoleophilaceae bacterium]
MLLKACINGAREPGEHAALPLTAEELARDAAACVAAGAGAVHLHPRDRHGRETLDPVAVDAAVEAVRELVGAPVGVSTGAWIEPELMSRVAAVHQWSEPDFASVNLSEEGALEVMAALVDRGIEVEAGLASAEEVERLVSGGMAEGLLRVLIEPAGEDAADQLATARAIDGALDRAAVKAPRLGHGLGVATWSVLEWSAARGHDLRIGLEDTLVMADGSPAEGNAALVAAAAVLLT